MTYLGASAARDGAGGARQHQRRAGELGLGAAGGGEIEAHRLAGQRLQIHRRAEARQRAVGAGAIGGHRLDLDLARTVGEIAGEQRAVGDLHEVRQAARPRGGPAPWRRRRRAWSRWPRPGPRLPTAIQSTATPAPRVKNRSSFSPSLSWPGGGFSSTTFQPALS
jgi:hypothetical protein